MAGHSVIDSTVSGAERAFAPVVVFAYKRPDHLRQTIESLRANAFARETDLIVYCDGAKNTADAHAVAAVRAYVRSIDGFASVTVREREANLGLANSIIAGVTEVLSVHSRVIVLEDDLRLSAHFLQYMNDALTVYEDDPQVASIHGYTHPVIDALPDTFFMQGADCWGWATWRRGWEHFESDGALLLAELRRRNLTRAFDLNGAYPNTKMLQDQITGKNDSWAIRWHASCYLRGMLTLFPGRSLVENTGNDSSGTHCDTSDVYSLDVAREPVHVSRIPMVPSESAQRVFAGFLRRASRRQVFGRIRSAVAKLGAVR